MFSSKMFHDKEIRVAQTLMRRIHKSFSALQESFATLAGRNRITENWVIRLRGESDDRGGAVVFLSCRTSTTSSYGLVPSTWSFEIDEQDDGRWEITRIIFESLMGREPERAL